MFIIVFVVVALFAIIALIVLYTLWYKCTQKGRAFDESRIQNIVKFVKTHVEFYRRMPASSTFKDFPTITKSFIKNNLNDMLSDTCKERRIMSSQETANNSWTEKKLIKKDGSMLDMLQYAFLMLQGYSLAQVTGGTSGEYFYQWYNIGDIYHGLYSFVQGWENIGWRYNDRILLYYFHGANTIKLLKAFPQWSLRVLVPQISESGDLIQETFEDFCACLESFQPKLIVSFPSIIFRMCELALSSGKTFTFQPKYMDLSADFLFSCQYKFIKSFFPKTDIRMSYGTIEYGQIAQQIPGTMYNYTVYPDCAYVEQGEKGTLIVTNLNYTCLPIIRYAIDDVGKVTYNPKTKCQEIHALVGKSNPYGVSYIRIDGLIERCNKLYNTHIINLRLDVNTRTVFVVSTDEEHDSMFMKHMNFIEGYDVKLLSCLQNHCPTIDRYDRKNTPLLQQYRFASKS
jgi:phenylacetate-coenzyme A ligase PaaK-like adenylate-forming protein